MGETIKETQERIATKVQERFNTAYNEAVLVAEKLSDDELMEFAESQEDESIQLDAVIKALHDEERKRFRK